MKWLLFVFVLALTPNSFAKEVVELWVAQGGVHWSEETAEVTFGTLEKVSIELIPQEKKDEGDPTYEFGYWTKEMPMFGKTNVVFIMVDKRTIPSKPPQYFIEAEIRRDGKLLVSGSFATDEIENLNDLSLRPGVPINEGSGAFSRPHLFVCRQEVCEKTLILLSEKKKVETLLRERN